MGGGVVAVFSKMFAESDIGEIASLREAVHSLANLDEDGAVVHEWEEIVLLDDVVRDSFERDAHVFIPFHGGIEIEIFDIHGHEFCVESRESTVDEQFDGGELSGLGANAAVVLDAVASSSEADAVWLLFGWLVGCDDADVGSLSAGREVRVLDDVDCVGAFKGVGN